MKQHLYYFDIYPKVFVVGRERVITVRPISDKRVFPSGEYRISVMSLDLGSPHHYPDNRFDIDLTRAEDGYLSFKYLAATEGEYRVRIFKRNGDEYERLVRDLSFYALGEDLAERIPLRGDFHMHTCRSDGREDPGTVCANYRRMGYDFIAVTDHGRYYPSLEAMEIYKNASLTVLPGEEVHMPLTDMHIVNVGGLFSVNGLLDSSANNSEMGSARKYRSLYGEAPEVMTYEEYCRQIKEIKGDRGKRGMCGLSRECKQNLVCGCSMDKQKNKGGWRYFDICSPLLDSRYVSHSRAADHVHDEEASV